MNFTREPLVETIITPKEGYKLVIRNCRGGQEEFFVDAIEVISFGNSCFFRSLEKPKHFLVPVNEYEVIEVREPRVVLKSQTVEKGIKIAGGRETPLKAVKETSEDVVEETQFIPSEVKVEKRKDKKRFRKRKEKSEEEGPESLTPTPTSEEALPFLTTERVSLIPPPSLLISQTLIRPKPIPSQEETSPQPSLEPEKASSEEETPF